MAKSRDNKQGISLNRKKNTYGSVTTKYSIGHHIFCKRKVHQVTVFVCIEVLRPSQQLKSCRAGTQLPKSNMIFFALCIRKTCLIAIFA